LKNIDEKVIREFGQEWTKFNFDSESQQILEETFLDYFSIFPWNILSKNAVGFDMGCGSGRWAKFIAPKVRELNCIEPSNAIEVAKKNLRNYDNVNFLNETTEDCSLPSNSQDFGYCLGVLHHIPNTQDAINDCVRLLKKGAPFLLYIYYNFENKPPWFKFIWQLSDAIRKVVSVLPKNLKYPICNIIAVLVYFPLSRVAFLLEKFGVNVENIPLSQYRNKPFYYCKNDSLDRFGTRLEQRFSKSQITNMLLKSGCKNIKFSSNSPFWCCTAVKK